MSANDGLKYPANFQEFMGVVSRWHGAREAVLRPGEGVGDMLLRTAHELDDAAVIFRQVWELADAARHGADTEGSKSDEKEPTGFGRILGTRLRESGSVEWPALDREESDTALLKESMEALDDAAAFIAGALLHFAKDRDEAIEQQLPRIRRTLAKLRERLKP